MERFAVEKLEKWKNSPGRKPLVLYGVRQAGKTWLMKEFGARFYKSVAYISFDSNPTLKSIFTKGLDIPRIIKELSIAADTKISPETLIIFDEVQECPLALTSLKYFNENANEYHIIAAGSLLGVMNLEGSGFPVGKVDTLTLYPMSFYEFLAAVDRRFLEPLKKSDFRTISTFHNSLVELLKQYFYVGGMPAAVKNFAETKSFSDVREVQNGILNSYYADFAKHIPSATIGRVRDIWLSVPVQLAKENKRFLYADLKAGARGRSYDMGLQWLKDAGLITRLYRVSRPNMPLIAYMQQAIFKLYMGDIGLLSAQTGLDAKTYLDDDTKTFTHYKGALAEQFVLQELIAANDRLPVYYWATDKNTAEIEFVIQIDGSIIPIEVKSGRNTKSASLKAYKELYSPDVTIKTSLSEYSRNRGDYNIPLYMIADFVDRRYIMD